MLQNTAWYTSGKLCNNTTDDWIHFWHRLMHANRRTPSHVTLLLSFSHFSCIDFIYQDHFMSPLGCRVLRFEFSWGAVPPCICCDTPAFACSLNLTPFSLRLEKGASSRIDGVAIDDREVRSIDVRGNRLLLIDEFPANSTLVLLATWGCGLSLLLGRYNIESLLLGAAATLLGVTLASTNTECDTLLAWVGVIGVDVLCWSDGGVYELVRLATWVGRGRPPLLPSESLSKLDLTRSFAIFLTNTALSFSARRWMVSKRLWPRIPSASSSLVSQMLRTIRSKLSLTTAFLWLSFWRIPENKSGRARDVAIGELNRRSFCKGSSRL